MRKYLEVNTQNLLLKQVIKRADLKFSSHALRSDSSVTYQVKVQPHTSYCQISQTHFTLVAQTSLSAMAKKKVCWSEKNLIFSDDEFREPCLRTVVLFSQPYHKKVVMLRPSDDIDTYWKQDPMKLQTTEPFSQIGREVQSEMLTLSQIVGSVLFALTFWVSNMNWLLVASTKTLELPPTIVCFSQTEQQNQPMVFRIVALFLTSIAQISQSSIDTSVTYKSFCSLSYSITLVRVQLSLNQKAQSSFLESTGKLYREKPVQLATIQSTQQETDLFEESFSQTIMQRLQAVRQIREPWSFEKESEQVQREESRIYTEIEPFQLQTLQQKQSRVDS